MDVDLVSNISSARLPGSSTAQPESIDLAFAATMAANLDDGASVVAEAEQMVGTRIRAPAGGCGCDAFVDTVLPNTASTNTAATNAALPNAAPPNSVAPTLGDGFGLQQALVQPRSTFAPTRQTGLPGQILELDDPADLSGHLHRAILRNATEMISAHRNGVVEVLSIPWEQVRG